MCRKSRRTTAPFEWRTRKLFPLPRSPRVLRNAENRRLLFPCLAGPPAERIVGYVIAGINLLLDKLECPIDVIIIPGNHGRTTRRPESKLYVLTNYDSLVGDFVELYYQSSKRKRRPKFYSPASGDALMSLFGWNFLITHGDRIGSRGGTGFGGPIYTIARGFKRLTQDYAARRI